MPSQKNQSSIADSAAHNSEVRAAGDGGAAAQPQPAGAGGSDAPPSNTASDGYNGDDRGYRLLRVGVDSLYLSFHGDIFPGIDSELGQLKYLAQSRYPDDKAKAQKQIGKHIFEVWDRGQPPFSYILQDGAYRICVSSGESGRLPLAYVKVSAELLAYKLPEEVVDELSAIVQELGERAGLPNVSRIDLFADFVTDTDFGATPDHAWVMQGDKLDRHVDKNRLTGWSFSPGGILSARLYDKTYEIQKVSHKTHLHALWKRNGWNGEATVWRMEFQFMREILASLRVSTFEQIKEKLGSLWQTVTGSWLRLTVPSDSDTNRSRWPTHPTWAKLSEIRWRLDDVPLTRHYNPARVPSDDYLARTSVSVTTSYMAKYKIRDYGQGAAQLQDKAKELVGARCKDKLNIGFDDWIAQQVSIKSKQFNTRLNIRTPEQEATTSDKDDSDAVEYYEQSKGE